MNKNTRPRLPNSGPTDAAAKPTMRDSQASGIAGIGRLRSMVGSLFAAPVVIGWTVSGGTRRRWRSEPIRKPLWRVVLVNTGFAVVIASIWWLRHG